MPELSSLLLFSAAAFALIVVPGPAVLYIVSRSLDQGRAAGLISVVGINAGALVHIFAAAVGLSALLASSVFAFSVVKYAGAAYLIYLGLQKLLRRPEAASTKISHTQPLSGVFWEGVIVNVLNPKTALFFLAFLPQFVDLSRSNVPAQILILGATFILIAFVSDGVYALLAGSLRTWLKQSRQFLHVQHYVSACVYLLLGVGAALSGSGKK